MKLFFRMFYPFCSFEYNATAEFVKEVQFEEVEGLVPFCSRILPLPNYLPNYLLLTPVNDFTGLWDPESFLFI